MAPEMNSQNCGNCRHRRRKSTFPRCMGCVKDKCPDNQFPGWEAPEIQDGRPYYDEP